MDMPTYIDAIFAIILFASAVIGLMRGFVREFLSLLGWVMALWVSIRYGHFLTPFLERFFQANAWLDIVSAVICFVMVLFFFNYLSMLLKEGFIKRDFLQQISRLALYLVSFAACLSV